MALRIVGTQARRGLSFAETGINVRRFQVRYFPEMDIRHPNYLGQTVFRSISTAFSREVICEGEITGTTGVMAFTLGTVLGFANRVTHFAPATGTLLLDEANIISDRTGWQSVSVRASSDPLL